MDPIALAETLAHAWQGAILNGSPVGLHQFKWSRDVQLGDLVSVEFTNKAAPGTTLGHWTGAWTYMEKDEDGSLVPLELVYEITQLDGSIITWTNVELCKVPKDAQEVIESKYDQQVCCGVWGPGHRYTCAYAFGREAN